MFDELYKQCCVMYVEENPCITTAAKLLVEAKTPEEKEKGNKLYLKIVHQSGQQTVNAIKISIKDEDSVSYKYFGDKPRKEILVGGFVFEYPYLVDGTLIFPSDNMFRAVHSICKATSPEEKKVAEELKKQVIERENEVFKEILESISIE